MKCVYSLYRYPDDNPLWEDVAKRYQQIVEKEYKLLNTCSPYCDGQTIPQNGHVSLKANTSNLRDTNLKDLLCKERIKRPTAKKCKPAIEQMDLSKIVIKERSCTSNMKEMENPTFPKIVEVYSLKSPIQAEETVNRKRKFQQGLISGIEEKTWRDNTTDRNPPTSGFSSKKSCADIFIDLTVDEEEETRVCSPEDTRNMNGNYQPERELVRPPKEADTTDKEKEREVIKSKTSKRKRVFPGRRKKIKSNKPTMQKKRETDEMTTNKNNCNDEDSQLEAYNRFDLEIKKSSGDGHGVDQNNNEVTRKNAEEFDKNLMCSNQNDSDRSALGMSYREHKITDLKAKLVQQEEELAKLKALKRYDIAVEKIPQTLLNHDETVANSKQTENFTMKPVNEKREEHNPKSRTVNLDDICQHVIKSFNIFNARVCEDNRIEKEGINGHQIATKKNAEGPANGYIGHGRGNKQDKFLFQVGLRRKLLT